MRSRVTSSLLAAVLIAPPTAGGPALVPRDGLDNGLARTPPMGWNSWNHFGCNVSEALTAKRPTPSWRAASVRRGTATW